MIFFGPRQAAEDCPPILRVLDAKKQIIGTHRSCKHNLQHPYAPKCAIFHQKNGQQWPFFGQKLGFLGSPPFLRALDAKKQIVGTHRSRKHNLQHPYAPKYAIFHEKTAKNGLFLSNIDFLALYKQLKDPPPHFEGAGCKKASCGHTKITKTHFVASVCTTICRFSWKKRLKMAISWSKNDFFWPQTSG